jgi:hypothetical protein
MSLPFARPLPFHRSLLSQTGLSVIALCLAACSPVTRRGLEPLVTDRPDFTESTETVPQGMRQLEAGTTFGNQLAEESASLGESLLRIGTSAHTELRVALNSYAYSRSGGQTVQGFEDVTLGTKIKLMSGGGDGSLKPALAVIVGSTIPTGGPRVTAGRFQPEVKFGLAWDLTSRVAFSSNLNYAHITDETGTHGEYAATGSLGVGLTEHVASYAEYYTFQPVGTWLPSTHYFNGGLTFGFTDNLQLDVRSGLGLHRIAGPDYFLGLGISRRW